MGGECVSVVFVWWGILCALPPHSGGGWGHCGWWGVWCGGGWHSNGRAGAVMVTLPFSVGVPRLCVGVPLVVYPVALLNGGVGWVCVVPVFGLGPPLCVVLSSRIVLSLFCLVLWVLSCLLWVGKCGGVVWCGVWNCVPLFPSALCVCCYSIVGLGVCLCVGVVSLWNGGGGGVCVSALHVLCRVWW